MKIFNPRHFLRHIAPTVLQDFVQSHPLGAHLSVDWTLPEPKLATALTDAVENLQAQLLEDIALTTAKKVALEEDLFRWNEDLRRAHITGTEAGAREFSLALAQHEYDAYVSFAYNVGPRAFCQSTLVKKLNTQDYPGACQELLRWRFFQGKDCALPTNARLCGGLVTRREAEYRQCMGEAAP